MQPGQEPGTDELWKISHYTWCQERDQDLLSLIVLFLVLAPLSVNIALVRKH